MLKRDLLKNPEILTFADILDQDKEEIKQLLSKLRMNPEKFIQEFKKDD
jgi:hypothetical protein